MPIYHFEAKVISRGTGRSAVAASAYMSCSKILNDYDGVQHDYTRKQGLVWEQVFIPENAPAEWKDRANLWNAVEEAEKTKDSRLAREFVAALPIELNESDWVDLLTDFIKTNFTDDGMCADVAIHDTDGHNPHAHIMLTVRPLDERGKWQYKTEKEYLCVKNGEEHGFTATEFKQAQSDGWEKQYQYKVGKKKVYMVPSEAEKFGYERLSKYPKATKLGRQNPIAARWNSEKQLALWREAWANAVNRSLEQNEIAERIDHRSHAERGLIEQPTIHEGVIARALEKKGIVSDRCELNRQIRRDNAELREIRQEIEKLKSAVSDVGATLENLRARLIILMYQLLNIGKGKANIKEYLSDTKPKIARLTSLVNRIKTVENERRAVVKEKKNTPAWQILKHQELNKRLSELTEDLEELRSEKARLLAEFNCSEEDISTAIKSVKSQETKLAELENMEKKYLEEFETVKGEYAELKDDVPDEILSEILKTSEQKAAEKIRSAYRDRTDYSLIEQCINEVDDALGEAREKESITEKLIRNKEEHKHGDYRYRNLQIKVNRKNEKIYEEEKKHSKAGDA